MWTAQTNTQLISVKPEFTVSDGIAPVSTGLASQTDFTPPTLAAGNIAVPSDDIDIGQHATIGYREAFAVANREFVFKAEFQFKNSAGEIISFKDRKGLGEASI